MTRFIILVVALLFALPESTNAQELSYGFRVGLNVSTFLGDEEMDAGGTSLESFSTNTGFHVGGGVRIEFTELFGIRTEILFTQKGTKRTFSGDSFLLFNGPNGKIFTTGNRSIALNISNAYLEIPVLAYGKIGDKFEVFGGVYAGFLVSSIATGELIYTGGVVEGNNNIIPTLEIALDYNYLRDTPGERINGVEDIPVMVGNENVVIPNTLSAYYDLDEKNGSPYNILDAGVSAGAAYFMNGGLYISAIANYGLVDVSNEDMDFSNAEINGLDFVTRDDRDSNLSFQFSVGFSF